MPEKGTILKFTDQKGFLSPDHGNSSSDTINSISISDNSSNFTLVTFNDASQAKPGAV